MNVNAVFGARRLVSLRGVTVKRKDEDRSQGGQTDDLISAGRSVINQALAWESCPWEK